MGVIFFFTCSVFGQVEKGIASYYADKFNGRLTANGEIFQPHKYTAAHKKLPFGTKVKVTNLKNNKAIILRINDRGPFIKGRIIDLSPIAAEKLGFKHAGITDVKVEIVSKEEKITGEVIDWEKKKQDFFAAAKEKDLQLVKKNQLYHINALGNPNKGFGLQIAKLQNHSAVFSLVYELAAYFDNKIRIISEQNKNKQIHRVLVGEFSTKKEAEELQHILLEKYPEIKIKDYQIFENS